jgi:5-methylcytosine-specific restriction endonuclease McrA
MARPKKWLTEDERRGAIQKAKAKWREANRDRENEKAAVRGREKRARRAVAEGRPVGKTGNWTKFTKEELRQKRKEYVEKNRDLIRLHVRVRNAKKKAQSVGSAGNHTKADIELLWEAQKGRCVFCLKPLMGGKYHVDHHVPLAKGGSNDRSNLRLLHKKCNLEKGARDPVEHAQRNGMLCW